MKLKKICLFLCLILAFSSLFCLVGCSNVKDEGEKKSSSDFQIGEWDPIK